MKNRALISMAIIACLAFWSCTEDLFTFGTYENPYATACINFVNGYTGEKLDSVKLTIYEIQAWSTWKANTYYVYSNLDGKACVTYTKGFAPKLLECSKPGFVCLPQDLNFTDMEFTTTIKMYPVSYLQLRVRNVLPSDPHDVFVYQAPGTDCHQLINLEFKGDRVDTTVVVPTLCGNYPLTYQVYNPLGELDYVDTKYYEYKYHQTTTVVINY